MALYMRGYAIAKGSAFAGSSLLITQCSFRQQEYWNDGKKTVKLIRNESTLPLNGEDVTFIIQFWR